MNRLASDRFLPNKLGKWLQKSHNVEIWSCDEHNDKLIAQRNKKNTGYSKEATHLKEEQKKISLYIVTLHQVTQKNPFQLQYIGENTHQI